jgi:DNA-binding NtrC family response regulator
MHGLPTILVVDDEPDICWALANILRPIGYAVATAISGAEALALVAGCERPYAVAFVDAKLPDADGLELAAQIRQQSPQTAIVLISGYYYEEDSTVIEGLRQHLIVGFVSKPFDMDQIRLQADRAVEHAPRKGNEADDLHSAG